MDLVTLLFFLMVVYQLKHFLADYLFQGKYMLGKFKTTGWLGPLAAHVAVHGVMTAIIAGAGIRFLGECGMDVLRGHFWWEWALGVGLFDANVHFIMDRLKAAPHYMGRWKPLTASEYLECHQYLVLPQDRKDLQDRIIRVQSRILRGPTQPEPVLERQEVYVRQRLRGNTLFWWALGFDQMVHHLTHYACIYFILKLAGML